MIIVAARQWIWVTEGIIYFWLYIILCWLNFIYCKFLNNFIVRNNNYFYTPSIFSHLIVKHLTKHGFICHNWKINIGTILLTKLQALAEFTLLTNDWLLYQDSFQNTMLYFSHHIFSFFPTCDVFKVFPYFFILNSSCQGILQNHPQLWFVCVFFMIGKLCEMKGGLYHRCKAFFSSHHTRVCMVWTLLITISFSWSVAQK